MCPHCLGIGHLRQALTEEACPNCSCMPYDERSARLAAAEEETLPASGMPVLSPVRGPKRGHLRAEPTGAKKRRQGDDPLSHKVDTLASEFSQIKALLLNLQPGARAEAVALDPPRQARDGNNGRATAHVAGQREDDALSIAASDSLFTDETSEQEDLEEEAGSPSHSLVGSQEPGADAHAPVTGLSSAREAVQLALSRLGPGGPLWGGPTP